VACLVPLVPVPLQVVTAAAVPEWFSTRARELPAESVVVVLPYPVPTNPVAMRWQSAANYRFRMPGGYFLGPGPDGHAYVGGSADPPTANLLTKVVETGQAAAVTPQERAQAKTDLAAWGTDRIVLGPTPAQAALRETMSDLIGKQPGAGRNPDR
jgi:dolichyl-phosphate beta-glucosyltransferase